MSTESSSNQEELHGRPYTTFETIQLENEYKRSRYICRERRLELATPLQLSERKIEIWYQNRRVKSRKDEKNNKLSSSVEYRLSTSSKGLNQDHKISQGTPSSCGGQDRQHCLLTERSFSHQKVYLTPRETMPRRPKYASASPKSVIKSPPTASELPSFASLSYSKYHCASTSKATYTQLPDAYHDPTDDSSSSSSSSDFGSPLLDKRFFPGPTQHTKILFSDESLQSNSSALSPLASDGCVPSGAGLDLTNNISRYASTPSFYNPQSSGLAMHPKTSEEHGFSTVPSLHPAPICEDRSLLDAGEPLPDDPYYSYITPFEPDNPQPWTSPGENYDYYMSS